MYASFRPIGLPAVAPFHFWEVAGLSWGRIPQAALDVLYIHCLTCCQTARIGSETGCSELVNPLKEIPVQRKQDSGVSRVVTHQDDPLASAQLDDRLRQRVASVAATH